MLNLHSIISKAKEIKMPKGIYAIALSLSIGMNVGQILGSKTDNNSPDKKWRESAGFVISNAHAQSVDRQALSPAMKFQNDQITMLENKVAALQIIEQSNETLRAENALLREAVKTAAAKIAENTADLRQKMSVLEKACANGNMKMSSAITANPERKLKSSDSFSAAKTLISQMWNDIPEWVNLRVETKGGRIFIAYYDVSGYRAKPLPFKKIMEKKNVQDWMNRHYDESLSAQRSN